jgi:hypothetical protein
MGRRAPLGLAIAEQASGLGSGHVSHKVPSYLRDRYDRCLDHANHPIKGLPYAVHDDTFQSELN